MWSFVEPFGKAQLDTIHEATMQVLETTGACLQDESVLQMLERAGATVDYGKAVARIPEKLVRRCLETAPRRFDLVGRNGDRRFTMGDGQVHFACQNAASIEDLETGAFRAPSNDDTRSYARLVDALDNVELVFSAPSRNVPVPVLDVYDFEAIVSNTTKPFLVTTYRGAESVRTYVDMASIVLGGREKLRERPLFVAGAGFVSPLLRTKFHLEALGELARNGIPQSLCGQPIGGGTGPVTLAGLLLVSNAEALSAMVVTQLISPGTPVYYLGIPYAMDMKTGIAATGAPEHCLINAAIPQIARFYGLPCAVIVNTDSGLSDAQAGYEKALAIQAAIQAKADLVWGVGGMGPSLSYTQAVIDSEIVDYARRMERGIEVTPDTLALDVIEAVGHAKSYLAHLHTRAHFKRELLTPRLSNRFARGGWERAGGNDANARARTLARELIGSHVPVPLDEVIGRELQKYIEKAEQDRL